MTWKSEIEKLLRDQIRFCYPISANGDARLPDLEPEQFSDMLGYVLDHIENLIEKKAFFDGYAKGAEDTTSDINQHITIHIAGDFKQYEFIFNKDLSRVGAERAWLKRGQE